MARAVRGIRGKGVKGFVEADASVMFSAVGDVGVWTNRFSHRVDAGVAAAAPSNKRHRWPYQGIPLKDSIRASTKYYPSQMRVRSAVGSTKDYAFFVDQGTSSFEAKLLPPWFPGSASLYEHTWRPGPGQPAVGTIHVRGQEAQHFFDAGLAAGFRSMRMRSFQLPLEGASAFGASEAGGFEASFLNDSGDNAAFIADLAEWRQWKDEMWRTKWQTKEGLGRGRGIGSRYSQTAIQKALRAKARKRATVAPTPVRIVAPKKPRAPRADDVEARKKRERQQMIDEFNRKKRANETRAEKEAKEKAQREAEIKDMKFEKARLDAYRYLHGIERQYPDAVVQISKDKSMIRVHFDGPSGPHNVFFLGD